MLLVHLFSITVFHIQGQSLTDMHTNESYISGLMQKADNFEDNDEVFYKVLKSLNKHVMVYPSEHYYYYKLNLEGRPISGSILFSQEFLDSNKIFFCYVEKYPKEFMLRYLPKRISGNSPLSAENGVFIKKKNPFLYEVTCKDVSVEFEFYDPGLKKPENIKLRSTEEFLCNGMDESGLVHSLIYNEKSNSMFYVLNEEKNVPETFYAYNSNILIGKRTEFVYYNDSVNNRKILNWSVCGECSK